VSISFPPRLLEIILAVGTTLSPLPMRIKAFLARPMISLPERMRCNEMPGRALCRSTPWEDALRSFRHKPGITLRLHYSDLHFRAGPNLPQFPPVDSNRVWPSTVSQAPTERKNHYSSL